MHETYVLQDGCQNCKHVFIRTDYDEGPYFYCTLNAPPRPPCMSVGMDECTNHPGLLSDIDVEWEAAWDATYGKWEKWADERAVNSCGVCEYYERKPGV